MERISKKDLAAQWGVQPQRVDTLVREGKLSVGADGLIDKAEADVLRATMSPTHLEKEAVAREVGGQLPKASNHPLVAARTAKEVFSAKLAEQRYKTITGELVRRVDVKNEAFELGRFVQQRLLALPPRLSAELATLAALPPDKIEQAMREVLAREVRLVIGDLITGLDQLQAQTGA